MASAALLCYEPAIKSDWWGKDVRSSLGSALLAAAALAIAAAPAGAQLNYSNSYTFLKAVKERDSQKVTDLLASPSSTVINTKDAGNGNGALHILARERDGTWLNFLLTKGARADLQNASGDTPLLIATQIGWAEGADILLRRGANVDLANRQGETPLILAVQNRDIALVRLLLAKGANPKRTDSVAGYSALDYAKRDGARGASILKLLEAPPAKPARDVVGPKL
jgi:ankyrin repeat protein